MEETEKILPTLEARMILDIASASAAIFSVLRLCGSRQVVAPCRADERITSACASAASTTSQLVSKQHPPCNFNRQQHPHNPTQCNNSSSHRGVLMVGWRCHCVAPISFLLSPSFLSLGRGVGVGYSYIFHFFGFLLSSSPVQNSVG